MRKAKILFLVNVDWFFLSHRLPVAIAAAERGFEVHVATTITDKAHIIEESGFILHEVGISRGKTNLLSNLRTFLDIIKILRTVQPKIVHLVTIKPILLGGIAARLVNVQGVIAAISGLGYIFIDQGFFASCRRFFVRALYKFSLSHKNLKIICQNLSDLDEMQRTTKLPDSTFSIIDGSGVSLNKFQYSPDTHKIPQIMMASRMLKDKGVIEFAYAASILKKNNIAANFILVGEPDPDNPSSVSRSQIQDWEQKGILEYWGHKDNMEDVLSQASIVVLPSYREGFPKVLIEAAACGRAIVTTDVAGCRDAIYNGVTGVLVPVKDGPALAEAISTLVKKPETYIKMGIEGRKMAEERFDENKVIDQHLSLYNELLASGQ
jgi:glycosyltransferase involved in cell wall biosynthesis